MARRPRRSQRADRRQGQPKARATKQVFFAYPATPRAIPATIDSALNLLEADQAAKRDDITFLPWPRLNITGTTIMSEIIAAIDQSEVVAFDVTHQNDNVAFELGYALGKFKRIWISLNTGVDNASRQFNRRYTGLLDAGYAPYHNHKELATALLQDAPWQTPNKTILAPSYKTRRPRSIEPSLLYVKPPLDTDSVIAIGEHIPRSVFSQSFIVDDPSDNGGARLPWYAEKICDADAVLVHLLSAEDRGSTLYNGKASFIAGLTLGLDKHLLMLAREPFDCPADYGSLFRAYETASESVRMYEAWAASLEFERRRERGRHRSGGRGKRRVDIRELTLGDHVAEHEGRMLDEYFVETETYHAVQRPGLSIVVGRRGSGKSATLIALQEEFRHDNKVHVCGVSPVGYEVAGVLRLLAEEWPDSERGFLVESLWKFLLYSELAVSVVQEVENRPAHHVRTDDERQLVRFVEDNRDVLMASFSQRVSRAVAALGSIGKQGGLDQQRVKISEELHSNVLGRLRHLLGRALSQRDQVLLLIDRLDEQWRVGAETEGLATLLLGLFRVAQRIVSEFRDEVDERERVNISLAIFIRSDIFAHIGTEIPERDKLPIHRILWKEPELLIRVIHERLVHGRSRDVKPQALWDALFPLEVRGVPTDQFITKCCLPRPRDVLVLTKNAVRLAVERSHSEVKEEDLEAAYSEYSRYALESVSAEDDPQRGQLESVLYELAGVQSVLREGIIRSCIERSGVASGDVDYYLELLCDVNVLGIKTSSGFEFPNDEDHRHHLMRVGKVVASREGVEELSYSVHPAFRAALEVSAET